MNQSPERGDREVRALVDAGDQNGAATLALKLYGNEVRRFLVNRLRKEDLRDDAYQIFTERMWKALPTFDWRCELRIWLYKIARSVATNLSRLAVMWRERLCVPNDELAYWQIPVRDRSATADYLRTETKDRIRELRHSLSDGDQSLLLLRETRGLGWRDCAIVMGEVAADASEEELERAAKRMRMRYHATKTRLIRLIEAEGLVERAT